MTDDTVGVVLGERALQRAVQAPDFVASGSHTPGSARPELVHRRESPRGLLDDRYFRGTGTREAAAITSGAVALVLQKYPKMTPDQVKALFEATAPPAARQCQPARPGRRGARPAAMLTAKPPSKFDAEFAAATGTGSLEIARGQDHLTRDGVVLTGEQRHLRQAVRHARDGEARGRRQQLVGRQLERQHLVRLQLVRLHLGRASTWCGNSWSGSSWSGARGAATRWSGSSWSSKNWNGSSWSGSTWSGNSWSSDSWMGATWG